MKINITNTEALSAALDQVQVKARARTIDADDIRNAAAELEARLDDRLFKKDWKGVSAQINLYAQTFPSSYTGTPESTHFVLTRGAGAWFVTGLYRQTCNARAITLNLTSKGEALVAFAQDAIKDVA